MTFTLAPETEARLQAAAAKRGLAPEEVINVLLKQYDDTEGSELKAEQNWFQRALDGVDAEALVSAVQDTPEQARLRAALFDMVERAQALMSEPYRANLEQTEEERRFGEVVTEKYRKQGFNLP